MWRPFDSRFGDFKAALQAHHQILEAEQSLIQLRMVAEIRTSQAEEQRKALKAQEMMLRSIQIVNETGHHIKQEAREARHGMHSAPLETR